MVNQAYTISTRKHTKQGEIQDKLTPLSKWSTKYMQFPLKKHTKQGEVQDKLYCVAGFYY